MNLRGRLIALERRTPPAAPTDDTPFIGAVQFVTPTDAAVRAEIRRFLEELGASEAHLGCAVHPVAVFLPGEPEPTPVRCQGCGGWSLRLTAVWGLFDGA